MKKNQTSPLSAEELDEIQRRRKEARERARRLPPISDEEAARIEAAALSDPDALPLTDEQLSRMRPAHEVLPELVATWLRQRRGRPPAETTKKQVTLRLDQDVVDHFKASGPGWQTRINDALRDVAKKAAAGR
jgi:uncharacterized protein (DUF4415 family)